MMFAQRSNPASSSGTPIPASALLWLIAAFFILLLPQWDRLPPWLLGACGLLAGWRWLVQSGRVGLPGRWLRLTVMALLIATYIVTVEGRFTVDTAASFFVIAVGLKWLETRTSRDFYVLFFILVYLATVNFLFEQGIFWTLLNLAGVALLLLGIQVLNAPGAPHVLAAGWRRLGGMFLKSLPIVLLLFLFFPRLEPLWSVPLVSDRGQTGISDTMSPGDISNLAQSSERAFRVTFADGLPPNRELYWRGLILDRFDGTTWRQWDTERPTRPGRVSVDSGLEELQDNEYDVLMDPSGQRWAFALADSRAVSENLEEERWGLFRFKRPADTPVRYRLSRDTATLLNAGLSPAFRRRFLQLPAQGNPRARALASELRATSGSDRELVARLLTRFREQPYFYTLRPPLMPDDGIDTLLFDERRGFCEHYAGATTFVLRSAGIPARVVAGYQGGDPGANNEYLIVRQYDAHAWVEAWLPGSGWTRVDPTAAIAPDRIESGLREAVADEGSFLEDDWASPQRYGDQALIRWASLQVDRLNYQWQRWVVGYQGQSQLDLMSRLPGNIGMKELGYFSAGLVAFGLLLAGLVSAWKQRGILTRDPYLRVVAQWRQLLERSGLEAPTTATPSQLADSAEARWPALRGTARAFARMVNSHYYGASAGSVEPAQRKADLARLKRILGVNRRILRKAR